MRMIALAALVAATPTLAMAQEVPPIQQAQSSGPILPVADGMPETSRTNNVTVTVPPGLPPPVKLIGPSAPLNPKEAHGVSLARHWAARAVMPHPGEDGVVRFLYGQTLPSVVCSPLHVCDLELQPGEVVNNLNVGDKARWSITPGLSGSGTELVTHIMIKPYDAGLRTNLVVLTNRRSYSIDLVAEQSSWMPMVGFNYPGAEDNQWEQYRNMVGSGSSVSAANSSAVSGNVQFYCMEPDGQKPTWYPTRAYTDGQKTFIDFPAQLQYMSAPALVALSGGGFFSSPDAQVVNYRTMGSKYVIDQVIDRAELVSGVGSDKQSVNLHRGCN